MVSTSTLLLKKEQGESLTMDLSHHLEVVLLALVFIQERPRHLDHS